MASEPLLSGDGSLNELGIATMAVDYLADDFAEALTIGESEFEGLHEKPGGRSWKRTKTGKWRTTVIYEGLVGEVGRETFEVLPTRSEEPIETHHYLQELKDKYGGYLDSENKLKFPEHLPDGPGTFDRVLGMVGPGRNGQPSEKNPMFGFDSYFSKGLIVEHIFTTEEDPQPYIDADDQIVEEVPASYIRTPPGRNWVRQIQRIRELVKIGGSGDGGIVFELTVRYVLSRPGGHPPTKFLIEDLQ